LISVGEALDRLLALAEPVGTERVVLSEAGGRVLAADVVAARTQPPFAASAMDGYALRGAEIAAGARFRVIGEAPAGRPFAGTVGPGEAVRIFTGAAVPDGADFVVIQEDTEREGETLRLARHPSANPNIRPAGGDFRVGDRIAAPRRLGPADIALAAAMNAAEVTVARQPEVALIATGDELVQPGELPAPGQIVASNALGLQALFRTHGALPRLLPIARDTPGSLSAALALAEGADLVVTIGGASVGDHDLVARMGGTLGLERAFYKVAMRPGKPLIAGMLSGAPLVGLPGNPVSAMICGHIFILPMLDAMQGLPPRPLPRANARLADALPGNGPREHYMRARCVQGGVAAFPSQDSSLLSVLARADALIVRPPDDPPRPAGAHVEVCWLRNAPGPDAAAEY